MRNVILLSSLALLTASCSKNFKITGALDNVSNGVVYLEVLDSAKYQMVVVDSAQIADGKFQFHSQNGAPENEFVLLRIPHEKISIPLFLSNTNVEVEGSKDDIRNVKVSGSEWDELIRKFFDEVPEQETLVRLENEIRSMYGVKDEDRLSDLRRKYRNVIEEQTTYAKQFISENANSPVGSYLLLNNLDNFQFEEVDTLSQRMVREMPGDKYANMIVKITNDMRSEHEARKRIDVGRKAPNFSLPDADGNIVSLQSLQGKYVLLNFWASYCEKCRVNNGSLNELDNKFSNRDLVIMNISLNVHSEPWLQAIKEDKLVGIQLIDSTNVVAATYMILDKKLPCNILVDPDGIIVSNDIKSESIFAEISQELKKNRNKK